MSDQQERFRLSSEESVVAYEEVTTSPPAPLRRVSLRPRQPHGVHDQSIDQVDLDPEVSSSSESGSGSSDDYQPPNDENDEVEEDDIEDDDVLDEENDENVGDENVEDNRDEENGQEENDEEYVRDLSEEHVDFDTEEDEVQEIVQRASVEHVDYDPEEEAAQAIVQRASVEHVDYNPEEEVPQEIVQRASVEHVDYDPEEEAARESAQRESEEHFRYDPQEEAALRVYQRETEEHVDYVPEEEAARESAQRASKEHFHDDPEEAAARRLFQRETEEQVNFDDELAAQHSRNTRRVRWNDRNFVRRFDENERLGKHNFGKLHIFDDNDLEMQVEYPPTPPPYNPEVDRILHPNEDEECEFIGRSFSETVRINTPPVEEDSHDSDVQEIVVTPKKKRRRPPNVNSDEVVWKNKYGFRQLVKFSQTEVRPIPYRKIIKPIVHQQREQIKKRTRVTRRIMFNPIQQFQEEFEDTVLEKVPVLSLAETVKKLVDNAKVSYPVSEAFFDDLVPTAVEYEGTVKMFHFGRTMKKHSCKQKRLKFQTSWWNLEKKPFKKTRTGYVPTAIEPSVKYNTDKNLFEQHAMSLPHSASQLQKVLKKFVYRLNRRRTDNDVIRDSAYFVREFFLMKSGITLRVNRAVDIPDCFVPPILECGYYPLDALSVREKKLYLAARYQEAQIEYLSLTTRSIAPDEGFTVADITANELYAYHQMGRHIHGFYQVWETDAWFEDHDGTMRKYRYLVDIFNFLRFPLYMPYERWDSRLRVSFDRNSVFLLHLTEIIRVNRPIFTCLAQNKSLYKPITMREMCELMTAHDITPKYFMSTCGNYEFYDWARGIGNAEFLSAYCLIVGGSKTMKHIYDYEIERRTMLDTSDPRELVFVDRDSQIVAVETDDPVKTTFMRECFEDDEDIQVIRSRHDDPDYECDTTRFIIDIPKPVVNNKPPPLVTYKKPFEVAFSRRRLMRVRRKIYNLPPPPPKPAPKPPAKKKPGRKPVTMEMKLMQKYDFVETVVPSDIESDFEEYISDGEDLMDQHRPVLKRSTSAESVFMDSRIRDFPMEKVCWFHQRKIKNPLLTRKEKHIKKMRRIYRKHGLRYRIIDANKRSSHEMIECYHGKMERLALEIKNTKIAIRHGSYRHYNIPKVFVRGDAPIIDDCAGALRSIVTILVAKETASTRLSNALSNHLSIAMQHQRNAFLQLPVSSRVDLPRPVYISMELLTMRRMNNRSDIEDAKSAMRAHFDKKMDYYDSLPLNILHRWTRNARRDRAKIEDDKIAQFRIKKKARLDRIATMERTFHMNQYYYNDMSPDPEAVRAKEKARKKAAAAVKRAQTRQRKNAAAKSAAAAKRVAAAEAAEKARKKAEEESERRRVKYLLELEAKKKKAQEDKLIFEVKKNQEAQKKDQEQKSKEELRAAEAKKMEEERRKLLEKLAANEKRIEKEALERAAAIKRKLEEERLAKQKAEAQKAEAERLAKKAEAEKLAKKAEAERLAKKAEIERLARKAEIERLARKAEAERLAKKAEEERLAKKAEAERLAKQKAEQEKKAEAERLAKAEQEKKAAAERLAKKEAEEAAKKAAAERLEKQKAEEAKKAEEEAKRKAEKEAADRLAKQQAEARAEEARKKAEEDRIRLEAEAKKAEAERVAKIEAERVAEQAKKAEEEAKKAEAERVAKVEAERVAKAEAERVAKIEAERVARAEAERVAKVEAERVAEQAKQAEEEAKRKAEESEQIRLEEEAKKKAEQEEAERLAKKQADDKRKAEKEEARKKAKQREAEQLAKKQAKELTNRSLNHSFFENTSKTEEAVKNSTMLSEQQRSLREEAISFKAFVRAPVLKKEEPVTPQKRRSLKGQSDIGDSAGTLPDGQELDLFMISINPDDPMYVEAKQAFRQIDPRVLIWNRAQKWAIDFFKNRGVLSDQFFKYVSDLIEPASQRDQHDSYMAEALASVAKCFKYSLTPSNRRKWTFVPDDSLPRGLPNSADLSKIFPMNSTPLCSPNASFVTSVTPASTTAVGKNLSLMPNASGIVTSDSQHCSAAHEKTDSTSLAAADATCPATENSPSPDVADGRDSDAGSHAFEAQELDTLCKSQTLWAPADATRNTLWDTIVLFEANENPNIKKLAKDGIENVFRRSKLPAEKKYQFVFEILGMVCVLLTGKVPKLADIERFFKKKELSLKLVSEDLKEIESMIKAASVCIVEANTYPDLHADLIQHNGFPFIGDRFTEIINKLTSLACKEEVRHQFVTDVDSDAVFCGLIIKLDECCQASLRELLTKKELTSKQNHELSRKIIGEWKKRQTNFYTSVLSKTYTNVEPNHPEFNIMCVWFNALKNRNAVGITRMTSEVQQRLHLPMSPEVEEIVTDVSVPVNLTALDQEDVKPDISALRKYQRTSTPVGSRPASFLAEMLQHSAVRATVPRDDDVIYIRPSPMKRRKEMSTIAETSQVVHEDVEETFRPDTFAEVSLSLRLPSKKDQKSMNTTLRAKRKAPTALDNAKPSKLPKYEMRLEDNVWKTMERTMADFSGYDKKRLMKFRAQHPRQTAIFNRFHMLVMVPLDNNGLVKYGVPTIHEIKKARFYQLRVEDDLESIRIAENSCLSFFENTVVEKKVFNEMKWSIKTGNHKKHAIDYFTDLNKYTSLKRFKRSLTRDETLKFKFRVYKHLWFMGSVLPDALCPDSHEDIDIGCDPTTPTCCAGCTSGDVILIHNCTCASHEDNATQTTIYAPATFVHVYGVCRFVGRFVCQHGPASHLQLEVSIPTINGNPAAYDPQSVKFVEYSADLRVNKKRTTYEELVKTFASPITEIREHLRNDSYTGMDDQSDSSGTESELTDSSNFSGDEEEVFDVFGNNTRGSNVTLLKSLTKEEILKLQERARRIRSRSVDSGLDDQVFDLNALKRTPSCTNFKEVQKYGEKKMKATRNEAATSVARKFEEEMDEETLGAKILDVSKLFFQMDELHDTTRELCIERMLRSKLSYKNTRQDDDLYGRHMHLKKLLEYSCLTKYCGVRATKKSVPRFNADCELTSGSTGSIVMDEYYKFEQYKARSVRFGRLATRRLKSFQKPNNRLLIGAYDRVFSYHVCLMEHVLNLVARHVFNPYAIYRAESTRDLKPIQKMLEKVKDSMEMIKNALFNYYPLNRQIAELDQLDADPNISKEEYQRNQATCARYLIERVRLPQSFTRVNTSVYSSWLNSSTEFESTFDIFNFALGETFAEDFGQENYCNAQFTNHYFDAPAIAHLSLTLIHDSNSFFNVLLGGFFLQNQKFYHFFERMMPATGLDMNMMMFYKHQSFIRLYDMVISRKTIVCPQDFMRCPDAPNSILFSAIIAHPKSEQSVTFCLAQLEMYHAHLSEYQADTPLMEQSHIGAAVAVFKETLCISVVNEQQIPCKGYQYKKAPLVQPGEKHRGARILGETIVHLIVSPDGKLSLAFKPNTSQEKNDRITIAHVNKMLIEPQIQWGAFVNAFISPSLNRLRELIKQKKRSKQRIFITPGNRNWPIAKEDKDWSTLRSQLQECSSSRHVAVSQDHPDSVQLIEQSASRHIAKKRDPQSDVSQYSKTPRMR